MSTDINNRPKGEDEELTSFIEHEPDLDSAEDLGSDTRDLNYVKLKGGFIFQFMEKDSNGVEIWHVFYMDVRRNNFDIKHGIIGEIRIKDGSWIFLDGLVIDLNEYNPFVKQVFCTSSQILPFVKGKPFYLSGKCKDSILPEPYDDPDFIVGMDEKVEDEVKDYYRKVANYSLEKQRKVLYNPEDRKHRMLAKVDNFLRIGYDINDAIKMIRPFCSKAISSDTHLLPTDSDNVDVLEILENKRLCKSNPNGILYPTGNFSSKQRQCTIQLYGYSLIPDYNKLKQREEELLEASRETVKAQVSIRKLTGKGIEVNEATTEAINNIVRLQTKSSRFEKWVIFPVILATLIVTIIVAIANWPSSRTNESISESVGDTNSQVEMKERNQNLSRRAKLQGLL